MVAVRTDTVRPDCYLAVKILRNLALITPSRQRFRRNECAGNAARGVVIVGALCLLTAACSNGDPVDAASPTPSEPSIASSPSGAVGVDVIATIPVGEVPLEATAGFGSIWSRTPRATRCPASIRVRMR
jgi:hypothetical protein